MDNDLAAPGKRTFGRKDVGVAAGLAIAVAALFHPLFSPVAAAQDSNKLTVFVGPVVYDDAIWMADDKGLYAAEGLDVDLRSFPSGSTALESFKAGQGDIVASGELPSVRYWASSGKDYRVMFILSRESEGEVGMARKEITKPTDLEGKVVATRVGSTGSWFLSEYLRKNGVDVSKVEIKNLSTQVLPTALCGGDISAFFIWQPFGTRTLEICPDEVYQLTTAKGYMHAYLVAGARAQWLGDPANRDKIVRFMRATLKGKAIAEKDFVSVAAYVDRKFGMSEQAARNVWDVLERPFAFDEAFYTDYCQLARWMGANNMLDEEFGFDEFVWLDGVGEVAPDMVVPPPDAC